MKNTSHSFYFFSTSYLIFKYFLLYIGDDNLLHEEIKRALTWNDCVAILETVARRSKNILQHEIACDNLITMFLKYFGYATHSRGGLKLTGVLTNFYMEIVEDNNKRVWRRSNDRTKIIMTKLGYILHA